MGGGSTQLASLGRDALSSPAGGGRRRKSAAELAAMKAERTSRVRQYSASLEPMVTTHQHKTKVEARNAFLKLFPLSSPDGFAGSGSGSPAF